MELPRKRRGAPFAQGSYRKRFAGSRTFEIAEDVDFVSLNATGHINRASGAPISTEKGTANGGTSPLYLSEVTRSRLNSFMFQPSVEGQRDSNSLSASLQ